MQRPALLLTALTLAIIAGCQPQIGDACRNAAQCGEGQVCDISVRGAGGYCTIFDCREGDCPSGSSCIDFGERTACMARCSSQGDCRRDDGFVCRDDRGPIRFCYQPEVEPQPPPVDIELERPDGPDATDAVEEDADASDVIDEDAADEDAADEDAD